MTETSGTAEQSAIPTCYRHPGRETYIRCARCNRPICPECMHPAAVGFQCPECVQEGARSTVSPRTALGGEVREQGQLVTKVLIGLNVLVYLAGFVDGGLTNRLSLLKFGLLDGEPVGVSTGEWYRVLTATFVHSGTLHILFNMYILWVLGQLLEPVLGRWRFTALYLLSAIGGSAFSLWGLPLTGSSVGASGAVFGLFGAGIVILRKFGRDFSGLAVVLAINLGLSFVVNGIDWHAHIGGLATGALVGAVFAYAPRAHRQLYGALGCAIVLAATLVAIVAVVPQRPF